MFEFFKKELLGPLIVAFIIWLAAAIWNHVDPYFFLHLLGGVAKTELKSLEQSAAADKLAREERIGTLNTRIAQAQQALKQPLNDANAAVTTQSLTDKQQELKELEKREGIKK